MNECTHKEILLSRYIIEDTLSGVRFEMCPKCYKRIFRLKGFKVIQTGNDYLVAESRKRDEDFKKSFRALSSVNKIKR